MENIEYLLKKTELKNYSEEEALEILKTECEIHGKDQQLIRCMEEFSELIEVILEFNIHGRMDYTNLCEELTDCMICTKVLQILFDIQKTDLNKEWNIYTDENLLNNCMLNLTVSSIKISKCLRNRKNADLRIINIINTIRETIENIIKYFDINSDDMLGIFKLKIERSNTRNNKYYEKNNINEFIELSNIETDKMDDIFKESIDKTLDNSAGRFIRRYRKKIFIKK